MTGEGRAMLEFATKWYRYGGGDEYILPEFGLVPAEFYRRLLGMVTTTPIDEMDLAMRNDLREFCLLKLSYTGPRNSQQLVHPHRTALNRVSQQTGS